MSQARKREARIFICVTWLPLPKFTIVLLPEGQTWLMTTAVVIISSVPEVILSSRSRRHQQLNVVTAVLFVR